MKTALRNVTKRYGKTYALRNVTLEFNSAEIVSVLGPNGAGKTTLLRCLAGIVGPDEGTVRYDKREFRRDDLDTRKRFFLLTRFSVPFLGTDYLAEHRHHTAAVRR